MLSLTRNPFEGLVSSYIQFGPSGKDAKTTGCTESRRLLKPGAKARQEERREPLPYIKRTDSLLT
jgi:hypothetical protein